MAKPLIWSLGFKKNHATVGTYFFSQGQEVDVLPVQEEGRDGGVPVQEAKVQAVLPFSLRGCYGCQGSKVADPLFFFV